MADDGISIEVTNAAAFAAAMVAAAAAVKDPAVTLTAARGAVTEAVPHAPRRSGRLAGAHTAAPAGASRARITVATPYAAVIHWGWPAHGIHRQEWIVANWQRSTKPLEVTAQAVQAAIDKAAAKT